MRIWVHPRITAKRPEVTDEAVVAAFAGTLRKVPRVDTDPTQWIGIGVDSRGRLLEYVAVEDGLDWIVFHAMRATKRAFRETGVEG